MVTALSIFPSESSWGSIYSLFGMIVSLVGILNFMRKLNWVRKILFSFCYLILIVSLIFIIDYVSVLNIKQAPRFSIYKITSDTAIYYDTPFYDVIRCNRDTKDEYYKIIKNQSYDNQNIQKYCN